MSVERRSLALVAALGVTALAFWQLRIVAPVRLPQPISRWNGDLYNIYYPGFAFAYAGDAWLPRWNPWQLAGAPFLAGYNGGFLYPPNWIATLVPVRLALPWLCVAHLLFAGVTTFAAACTLGLGRAAATLAGIAFMLSTRFVGEIFWPSYLAAAAWVPAVALAAGWCVAAPGARRGVPLGIALALQFLTGVAQQSCYEAHLFVLAGAAAWAAGPSWDGAYARRLAGALLVAGTIAAGLAAVQLLPTLEVVAAAVRGPGGLTLAETLPRSPSLDELLAVTGVAGPTLGLAVVAAIARCRRERWVAAAAAVVVVSVLVGVGSPVYARVFYRLPGVSLFRLPQRIVPIGTFALALLAGHGLEVARAADPRRVAAAGLVVVATALARETIAAAAFWLTLVAWTTGLVLVVYGRWPRVRDAAAWLVVLALVGDRFAAQRNPIMLTSQNPETFFAPPPAIEFVRTHAGADRVLVLKDWQRRFPYMEKAGELWGVHVVQDYEPLVADAYHRFLAPLEETNVDRPLFAGRFLPTPTSSGWRMLDMLAVRWVVVPRAVAWPAAGDRFRRVWGDADATVYENTHALPRAWLVGRRRVVPDVDAALAAVQAPGFDPRGEAVVDRDAAAPAWDDAPGGEARVTTERDDEVVLEVRSDRGGLLVLGDLYWPAWRAAVDGVPAAIARVDYLFRGVAVGPGPHEVRFVYRATPVWIGAAVGAATIGALLLGRRLKPTRPARTLAPR